MFSFTNPIDQEVWGLVLYIFEASGCNEVKMSLVVKGHENVVDFRPGFCPSLRISTRLQVVSICQGHLLHGCDGVQACGGTFESFHGMLETEQNI